MRSFVRWPTLCALLAAAACGTRTEAATALNPPVIDSLPGGIVHLKNTGPTAWTDTSGWKLVQTAAINPADGSPGEIGSVESLAISDDGTVYAMQRSPASIKVYGADGNFVRSIGREGDGPGEIRGGMLAVRGDTVVVQDPNAHRLTFFKADGTFIRTVQSTCCYWTGTLTIDSAGRIWSPGSVGKDGEGGWVRFGMDGVVRDTVRMPPSGGARSTDKFWRVDIKTGNNSMSMMMGIPLQPSDEQFLRSDGAVLMGNSARLAFAVLGNGKDTSRVFEAEAPRLPLSIAERDSVFESVILQQAEQYRDALRKSAKKDDLPGIWPAFTNTMSDKTGRVWVTLPGARGEVTRLIVFDRDGRLLGDVPPPSPKMVKNSAWGSDRLVFLDEDDTGRTVIRAFRLVTTRGK
jgi:hypothetical protein